MLQSEDLLVLAGLALVDATSIGTLVVPVWLLIDPDRRASDVVGYLGVLATFYALVGLLLLIALDPLGRLAENVANARPLAWLQLIVGVTVLGFGLAADRRSGGGRMKRFQQRLDRRSLTRLALVTGVIELVTMVPFLAALALLGRSGQPFVLDVVVVGGYVAVMVAPALTLVLLRSAAGHRGIRLLRGLDERLRRYADAAAATVLIVVGFLVAGDAAQRLDLVG